MEDKNWKLAPHIHLFRYTSKEGLDFELIIGNDWRLGLTLCGKNSFWWGVGVNRKTGDYTWLGTYFLPKWLGRTED